MILENPLKEREVIQQLSRAAMPIKNGNGDSIAKLKIIDAKSPIQPIPRKISPTRVNELAMLSTFEMLSSLISLSSSKRFSNPESSFIFLILS